MEKEIRLDEPALKSWEEGFPIGNGRLGAMVRGLPCSEIITLNEDTFWYGSHRDRGNPDGKQYLEKIRKLLEQGKVREADKLCYMAMTSIPKYFGAYEPMGELYIYFNHNDNISDYKRVLNLENALATVSYTVDGIRICREHFVSYPNQAMVFKISADKPMLDVHLNLMRRPCDMGTTPFEENILYMPGQCGPDGVRFDCLLSAKTDGELCRIGDFLGIKNASEIILYVTANSDFNEKNPFETALKQLRSVMSLDYETLKKQHIEDYQALYKRVEIEFYGECKDYLDRRLVKLRSGQQDKGLLELLFNFGRYLMISGSRPGSQAMNLQGIWNNVFAAPWECNYTININTEMNYWLAESAQLSECHEPLFDLIDRMIPNGERTAKELYGCDGFVAHHATNLWGDTAIEGISFPSSVWPMGGAWFSLHMWEHYLYTQDKEFLEKRAYPVMKNAALFFTQYMTQASDGYFVTGPSLSPENVYLLEDGTPGRECMAPEMDNQILRALFHAVTRACEILGRCDKEYEQFLFYFSKIRPTRINRYGGIMEWDRDYAEAEPGHRHLSPLFGLYPGNQISIDKTPELAEACAKTLSRRMENTTHDTFMGYFGWSGAWAAACYARLGYAEKALDCLNGLLCDSVSSSFLNNCPVFQIDGNFGAAAAVVELLLCSDEEKIVLLPALPKELNRGRFHGLATRGGFLVDADWEDETLTKAAITSIAGRKCRVKAEGLKGVDTIHAYEGGLLTFDTEKGRKYELYFDTN